MIILTLANVHIIIRFPVLIQHRVHRDVNPGLPFDWDLLVPFGLKMIMQQIASLDADVNGNTVNRWSFVQHIDLGNYPG